MRKLLFIVLLFLCGHAAAQNMRSLFLEAPDSVFPLLAKSVRTELVEFAGAGMRYPLENSLGGKSVLEVLTDDYMLLHSTASSKVQVKKLPYGGSFLICVVNTLYAEAASSRVAFFDSSWRRMDTSRLFSYPSIRDFFTPSATGIEAAVEMCDIYLVSLLLDKDNSTMVAEYTMPAYMEKGDAEKVLPLLQKIVYRWENGMFLKE